MFRGLLEDHLSFTRLYVFKYKNSVLSVGKIYKKLVILMYYIFDYKLIFASYIYCELIFHYICIQIFTTTYLVDFVCKY